MLVSRLQVLPLNRFFERLHFWKTGPKRLWFLLPRERQFLTNMLSLFDFYGFCYHMGWRMKRLLKYEKRNECLFMILYFFPIADNSAHFFLIFLWYRFQSKQTTFMNSPVPSENLGISTIFDHHTKELMRKTRRTGLVSRIPQEKQSIDRNLPGPGF